MGDMRKRGELWNGNAAGVKKGVGLGSSSSEDGGGREKQRKGGQHTKKKQRHTT